MPLHTIAPIYDEKSKLLILGSFPSVKSRELQFYYGHPQNRFWRVMAELLSVELPKSNEEKRNMLLEKNIALWDVIASCDIDGSADSSIRNVVPNDLSIVLDRADIQKIFINGGKAYELYKKYCQPQTKIKAVKLPSTSPMNAQYSLERLVREWREALI